MTRKKRKKLRLPFSFSSKKIKKWKKYQDKIRLKRLGKKWLVVGSLWLVVVFSFFGYRAFRFLTQPLVQERGSSVSTPCWNGKTQLNFLVFSSDYRFTYTTSYKSNTKERNYIENLGVASLNPMEGTLKILMIPAEILITTEKGVYPLKKLFALGQTANPPAETDFLVESIQSHLAVSFDGYIALEGEEGKEGEINIENLHQQLKFPKIILQIPQILQFIRTNLKTNLSAGQLFRLLWQVRKVRFDRLQVLEIPEHILSSKRLDSGEEVLVGNKRLLDEFVTRVFAEPEIVAERIKISVKNGTNTPGLAGEAARFLENLGIEVIEVGNAEWEDCEKTQILDYTGLLAPRTLQRLEDVFGVKSERVEVSEARRADVEIIVGEDF